MWRVTLKKLLFMLLCISMTSWFLMQAYVTTNRRNLTLNLAKLKLEAKVLERHEKSTLEKLNVIEVTEVLRNSQTTTTRTQTTEDYTTPAITTEANEQETIATTASNLPKVKDTIEDTSKNNDSDKLAVEYEKSENSLCPKIPPGLLGPLQVDSTYVPTFEEALNAAGDKMKMGCYKPDTCHARQRVAIIIPYKNREEHLLALSHHIHPILQRQMLHYCVFVAEQFDSGIFNKARIMNAAYKEVKKMIDPVFDCVVFHDVDMLIEDDRNMYSCTEMPKHMSTAIDKFNYTTGYGTEFGGVTAISVENYARINGHGNDFWGWGGEDNDIENRIQRNGLQINKVDENIGRFKMIKHLYPWRFSPQSGVGSWIQWTKFKSKQLHDLSGLSTLKYVVSYTKKEALWTKITIDIRTLVIENAKVHFLRTHDADVEFISKTAFTERVQYKESCHYVKYTGKNVNKTLGLIQKIEFGRVRTLEEAKVDCDNMETFCQSIVEEHMGQFSLRSTPYMKNNTMTYMSGLIHPSEMVEKHRTLSVHVKVCPKDTDYVSVLPTPIELDGDEKMGTSPAFSVEFTMRIYNPSNSILTFVADIDTVHRKVQKYKTDRNIETYSEFTSLGQKILLRQNLLNLNDTKAFQKYLIEETTLQDGKNVSLLKVKLPPIGLWRVPGFYVAKCSVVDEFGTSVMEWEMWYEVRGKNENINEKIQQREFEKFLQHSSNFKVQNNIPEDAPTGIHVAHVAQFKPGVVPPDTNFNKH